MILEPVILLLIVLFGLVNAAELTNDVDNELIKHNSQIQTEIETINQILPLNFSEYSTVRNLRGAINQKLQEIFNSQFPGQRFDRRQYTVENWPTEIDWFNGTCWSEADLIKINEGIPFYRFIKQQRSSLERQNISSEVMECLKNAVLNEEMTKRSTRRILFERFKLETGFDDVQFIDWKLVDQRKIPKKYDKVLINSDTLSSKFIFQNPEIINNIHFHKNFRSERKTEYVHDNCPAEELDIFQRDMDISENIQNICDLSYQHMALNSNLQRAFSKNDY